MDGACHLVSTARKRGKPSEFTQKTNPKNKIMEIQEITKGSKILISMPSAKIRIPNVEVEVQGITIFGEVMALNTPHVEGVRIPMIHCAGIPITEKGLEGLGLKNDLDFYDFPNDTEYPTTRILHIDGNYRLILNDRFYKNVNYIHEVQKYMWL